MDRTRKWLLAIGCAVLGVALLWALTAGRAAFVRHEEEASKPQPLSAAAAAQAASTARQWESAARDWGIQYVPDNVNYKHETQALNWSAGQVAEASRTPSDARLPEQERKLLSLSGAGLSSRIRTNMKLPSDLKPQPRSQGWSSWGDYWSGQFWSLGVNIHPGTVRTGRAVRLKDGTVRITVTGTQQLAVWGLPQTYELSPDGYVWNPTVGYYPFSDTLTLKGGKVIGAKTTDSNHWWLCPMVDGFEATDRLLPYFSGARNTAVLYYSGTGDALNRAIDADGYGNGGKHPMQPNPSFIYNGVLQPATGGD